MAAKRVKTANPYLSGERIAPKPVTGRERVADLIDATFSAYNAARLREACALLATKMLEPDVTVGLSVTGALTPAGLGLACLNPLMRAGFVDWVDAPEMPGARDDDRAGVESGLLQCGQEPLGLRRRANGR